MKRRMIGLAALILCGSMLFFSVQDLSERHHRMATMISAAADVTDYRETTTGKTTRRAVEVRFRTETGQDISGRYEVLFGWMAPKTGDVVDILYPPSAPSQILPASLLDLWLRPALLFVMMVAFSAVGFSALFRRPVSSNKIKG